VKKQEVRHSRKTVSNSEKYGIDLYLNTTIGQH